MMRRLDQAIGCCLLMIGIGVFAPISRGGVAQPDIASIRGGQSRALFGDGTGVMVGILDGGVDATHPALQGSMSAAKDFSKSGTTDDDRTDVGHGTGIMGIFLGHDAANGFTGLAPGAKFVNARVVNKVDYTNDTLIGNGIGWVVGKGAKVMNLSLGEPDARPDLNKLNLMLDYVAEKYGTVAVVAAGNENASAVQGAPNGQYNGFTVGATGGTNFDRVTDFSNYATATDLRTKPDLVAPGQGVTLATANWEAGSLYTDQGRGTSFAAPMVGGIVAQMMGYGKAHHLSVSPLAIKAILMAGSTHVYKNAGGTWVDRHEMTTATGVVIDQPLDEEQGAGRVDGVGAYNIYARKTDQSTRMTNWTLSGLRENGSFSMKLGNLKAGQHIDTALTWFRHVTRKDAGPSGLDGSDRFTQSASLANFSLTLLLNGKRFETSDSSWDNLDYLSLDVPKNGNYTLLVNRLPGSGLSMESFGLAARVLSNATIGNSVQSALARADRGTFNSTGAQRSFDPSTGVPEPAGNLAALMMICLWAMRRSRLSYRRN